MTEIPPSAEERRHVPDLLIENLTALTLVALGFAGLLLKLPDIGSGGLILSGCVLLKGPR